MVGDFKVGQCFWGDASVAEAEVVGAFGGVFGDVARGVFGSQLASWPTVDNLSVELVPKAHHQPRSVRHLHGEPDMGYGAANRFGQPRRIDTDLGWLVALAGTVQADQGVKVDHAATLDPQP